MHKLYLLIILLIFCSQSLFSNDSILNISDLKKKWFYIEGLPVKIGRPSNVDYSSVDYDRWLHDTPYIISNYTTMKNASYVNFERTRFIENISLSDSTNSKIFFEHCIFNSGTYIGDLKWCKELSFFDNNCEGQLMFSDANVEYLSFSSSTFTNDVDFRDVGTDFLNVCGIKTNKTIDFRGIRPLKEKTRFVVRLNTETDLTKILLDFSLCKLELEGVCISYDEKNQIYHYFLETAKQKGEMQSYEYLDKDYQYFKYHYYNNPFLIVLGFIQRIWWDYGYGKHYIFYWIAVLLSIFSSINIRFARKMNVCIYELPNLTKYINRRGNNGFFSRCYISFIYTTIVFFAISLHLDQLKFSNRRLLAYFFLIYISGLICLAYLGNYLLKL